MFRRTLLTAAALAALLGPSACEGTYFGGGKSDAPPDQADAQPEPEPVASAKEIGAPLYPPQDPPAPAETAAPHGDPLVDPIVVPDCRLQVIQKEEVPAQRDAVVKYIATPAKDGEAIPPDRELVLVGPDNQRKRFRRLKENDYVEVGQLMALLDDRLARNEWQVKVGKINVADADEKAAAKTAEEAHQRYLTQVRLQQTGIRGATSEEDVRGALLLWHKSTYDAQSKKEGVSLAKTEAEEAQTLVDMHRIYASIPGNIKTIYKSEGESVKQMEPVFLIRNLAKLRAEGLADIQYYSRIRQGMKAVVEPAEFQGPQQVLAGHTLEVTAVAVARDKSPVSASEDGTVRVWDRAARRERLILHHPNTGVRSVACTPAAAEANLCLSGAADGIGRLWDLDGKGEAPLHTLKDQHRGALTAVAFSPDGKICATGGEDHRVCLWRTATGEPLYSFVAHSGAITSIQFTPQARLVTGGRDNDIRLWALGEKGARLEQTFDHASGDVGYAGVSPDGRRFLFDQGKVLRVRSLPEGLTEGVIQSPSGGTNFNAFALFSPDGRLVVTSDASEGRMQLWRAPTAARRHATELRQLVSGERSRVMTSATFAADGNFLVTGSRDRQVVVWAVPPATEVERELTAEVVLVDPAVESSAGQFRVWAVLDNKDNRLLPGTTATLVIYPGE